MKSEKQIKLEETLFKVTGKQIEITVRGENKFTFSFEGEDQKAVNKLVRFFGDKAVVTNKPNDFYDKECEETYIYIEF